MSGAERRPLLQGTTDGEAKEPHSRRFWFVIPVVFGACLATALPTTTTLAIIRLILCRHWYAGHDPAALPRGRVPTEEMCSLPEIVTGYTLAATLMGIIDAIGALLAFGTINFFVKKYGRKPVLIALTCIALTAALLWLAALEAHGSLSLLIMSLAILCAGLGGIQGVVLVGRMFIVDTTTPIQRTSGLSFNGAASLIGLTPSFAVGGFITTYLGDVRAVYGVALVLHVIVLLYELLILPETYSLEERKRALAEMEHTVDAEAGDDEPGAPSWSQRVAGFFRPVLTIFEPLLILAEKIPGTHQRDYRLLMAAFASFVWYLSAHYIGLALMLRLSTEFHFPPDRNGLAMSILLGAKAVFLTCLFPLVIKYGRLLYGKRISSKDPTRTKQEVAKRFDSYVVVGSYIIDAVFICAIGLATTKEGIFLATILLGFGSGGHIALNSVLVASVHHSQTDEILSAVAMVESVGQVLSPIILGAIMSATINTFPAATFIVSACLALLAAVAFTIFKRMDVNKRRKDRRDSLVAAAS